MSNQQNHNETYNNETRFALMEQSLNHMNDRFDQSMNAMNDKIDYSMKTMNDKLDVSVATINQTLNRFEARFDKIDKEIRSNFFWTLGVIAGVVAVMAHGFHWF